MSDPRILTVRPEPGEYAWTFGGAPPVARIAPGTVLDLYTEDCFAGRVRSEKDLVSEVCEFPFLNPQTGPFHVEGAEPGDTVAVHFVSIEPARDWAASTTVPLFGALTSTHTTATLQPPLPETVWIWQLDRERHTALFSARDSDIRIELPMDPMHGTVGVAPANLEVRSALVPDAHGGNMDTPEMRAGVTCFLGVNVEGALLSLGDGHARQGEGETCGVAVECAMNTVVIVELLKGVATLAAHRVRHAHHLDRLGTPVGGRVPHIAARPGAVAGARLRVQRAGRVPVRDPGGRVAARQRLRHQLHLRRQTPQGVAAPARDPSRPTCATARDRHDAAPLSRTVTSPHLT